VWDPTIVKEFWEFLKIRRRRWLLLVAVVLFLLSALIAFVQSSLIAPFIYALF
jgi:hypothetical protein